MYKCMYVCMYVVDERLLTVCDGDWTYFILHSHKQDSHVPVVVIRPHMCNVNQERLIDD